MIITFIVIFAIVAVAAVVMSFRIMRKQENKALDAGNVDKRVLNNPLRSNPIIILYLITPVVMIVGALILGSYYNWGK